MRVTIFGTGHVGPVTGACLADVGNHVLCVDVDAGRIEALGHGRMPIFEPGLEPLVAANRRAGRPDFRTDARRLHGDRGDLLLCDWADASLEGADALAIVTEWKEIRSSDFTRVRAALGSRVVFDGRNIYDPGQVEQAGIAYYGIGRGHSVAAAVGEVA